MSDSSEDLGPIGIAHNTDSEDSDLGTVGLLSQSSEAASPEESDDSLGPRGIQARPIAATPSSSGVIEESATAPTPSSTGVTSFVTLASSGKAIVEVPIASTPSSRGVIVERATATTPSSNDVTSFRRIASSSNAIVEIPIASTLSSSGLMAERTTATTSSSNDVTANTSRECLLRLPHDGIKNQLIPMVRCTNGISVILSDAPATPEEKVPAQTAEHIDNIVAYLFGRRCRPVVPAIAEAAMLEVDKCEGAPKHRGSVHRSRPP